MPMGKIERRTKSVSRPVKATAKDKQQDRQIRVLRKRIGKPEIKYTDTEIQGGAVTTGTGVYVNGMAQGDQPFDRNGAQVKHFRYVIRGYFFLGNTANEDRLVRVLVVKDKAPRGAVPALFANTTNGGEGVLNTNAISTIPNMFAVQSTEWNDRFTILRDRVYTLHLNDTGISAALPFKLSGKLKGLTKYNQTTAAIAANATGALYVYYVTDDTTTVAVQVGMLVRVFFTDD